MNLIEIGRYLKSIREKKEIGFEEVYKATRIQISIIEDIEEGVSELSPAFLRGFIKTYAKFLEADIEKYFKEESKSPIQKESVQQEEVSQRRTLFPLKKNTKNLLGVLFLIGMVFLVYKEISKTFNQKSQQETRKQLDEKAWTEFTKKEVFSKKEIPREEPTKNTKALTFLEKLERSYFQQEVLIKSSKKIEIYFKVDNEKLETRNLLPEEWFYIKAIDKIYLRFDQAKGVQVFHNGKRLIFTGVFFERAFPSDTM